MADRLAIYDATLACRQVFRELGALPILEEWAENCLADLNLWANGAGALREGKASLDARLSSNPDAKTFVVNLLRMLQGFSEKCIKIGREIHGDTVKTSGLSQAMEDVKDIISQLSRITNSIRKAGTNARIQKADASYDATHPQIEALSQHLQVLLLAKPSKNGSIQAKASSQGIQLFSSIDDTTVIDSLSLTAIQQRLIEANLKRRNRFLYAQHHALKLSERDQVPSKSTLTPRKLPLPPVLDAFNGTTAERQMPIVFSATTATEVQDPILLPTETSAQPATTVISAISSRVTYPRPPPLGSDSNVFQCPCCCQTLPTFLARGSHWKKHLSKDVLPYTCILDDCPCPERLYHTKNLWLSHMFADHGGSSYWACLACNDSSERPVFYERSAFTDHLERAHSRGIRTQQIPMLVSAWQRKTSVLIHPCPLCGFEDQDSDAVLNHTAEHLHSFSLRSLPWAPGEYESVGDLYDGYYEEHSYFNTGRSVDTESELSRSMMSLEQTDLEESPAIGSGRKTAESNELTEGRIRDLLKNHDVENYTLHAFLEDGESQESFQEASSLANASDLGSVFLSQGKYEEAEDVLRQALSDTERVLGPENPDTLTIISKLGSALSRQGKYEEAERMFRQASQGQEKVLGPDHPDTFDSISNLGSVLSSQGKYVEAEYMFQRAFRGREKVLGPEHRDTFDSINKLGSALTSQAKYGEAEELQIKLQILRPGLSRAATEENWNENLPAQLKIRYNEMCQAVFANSGPLDISAEDKAFMRWQLRESIAMLSRMDHIVNWLLTIPNQEKNMKALLSMRMLLMKQFNIKDWTPNEDFTISPDFLKTSTAMIKNMFTGMNKKVQNQQQSQESEANSSNEPSGEVHDDDECDLHEASKSTSQG